MFADELIKTLEDEIILSAILKKSREFLILHPKTKINSKTKSDFFSKKAKLQKGYPLAYLIGEKWFYNRLFKINKDVLIPRPETELLVQLTKTSLRDSKTQGIDYKKVIDVGTGSGAIIISVNLEIASANPNNKIAFYGIDISSKAIAVAKNNSKRLKTKKIKYYRGNLLNPLRKELLNNSNLLILANLPYLAEKELNEPTIRYEPKLALLGGRTDLEIISKLLSQISALKIKKSKIILEINYNQAEKIKKLVLKLWPSSKVKAHRDLAHHYRVIEVTLP